MGVGAYACGAQPEDEEWVSFRDSDGEIKVLIIALNYAYSPGAELTCTKDAKTMFRIAERAEVRDVTVLTDKVGVGATNFPTRQVVLKNLISVAKRCQPGDWFVWFWAGHGVNVRDHNGDERTGFDQAFVTPDAKGALTESAVLTDDDFARALDTYVPEGVRILCICDCCHSGTICDIDSFAYRHEIYQISASQDEEEAEDIGSGGVLTTALRRAVRRLSLRHGQQEFSILDVFTRCKKYARRLTNAQELSFQFSGTDPSLVAWPLCFPPWEYLKHPLLRVSLKEYIEDEAEDALADQNDRSDDSD
eukprot:TRINITY_DN2574_c0_g5_i1.p1 TRINITY_DN2574_c0_g5~~TRINITY_DN2574_c0_g5_i1.p1  ORF type:complete len:306 (-),score=61.83 TRINITY_DN2574_c0_g5_i1:268-1185(-)